MSELTEYTVHLGGLPHTLLLDKENAKRLGLTDSDRAGADTKAATPANKARTADNKS